MIQLNDLLRPSEWEIYWTFFGFNHDGLPDDANYVIFEYYCDDIICDCESLVAEIKQLGPDGEPTEEVQALINYNWSTKETECHPTLDEASPQTPLAEALLEVFKKGIHTPDYFARIKSDYKRVKILSAEKASGKKPAAKAASNDKVKKKGRNEPCICGSGKKFKKCCNGKYL